MKRFWISWWTDDYANAIERSTFDFWISGQRGFDDDETQFSICAVIDAESEKSAWRKAQKYFAVMETRFANEKAMGWVPEGDRFVVKGKLRTGTK